MTLAFTVLGVSQPKGSTRAFLPRGWTRPVITSDNPKGKGWQHTIASVAAQALADSRLQPFASGPVSLDVTFWLPRPKKYQTKKYADVAVPHVSKPDTDKLVRAVKDALTRVVWHDDSQVNLLIARKRYCATGDLPRASIVIRGAVGVAYQEQQKVVNSGTGQLADQLGSNVDRQRSDWRRRGTV